MGKITYELVKPDVSHIGNTKDCDRALRLFNKAYDDDDKITCGNELSNETENLIEKYETLTIAFDDAINVIGNAEEAMKGLLEFLPFVGYAPYVASAETWISENLQDDYHVIEPTVFNPNHIAKAIVVMTSEEDYTLFRIKFG